MQIFLIILLLILIMIIIWHFLTGIPYKWLNLHLRNVSLTILIKNTDEKT